MPKIVLLILALAVGGAAVAQENYAYGDPEGFAFDDFRDIAVDTTLFYAPRGGHEGVFSSMARFGFMFTEYSPRGMETMPGRVSIGGIEIGGGIGRYADYSWLSVVSGVLPGTSVGLAEPASGLLGPLAATIYDPFPASISPGWSATYTYSMRRYRHGARLRWAGAFGRGWNAAVTVRGRFGDDSRIAGVFSREAAVSAALSRELAGGARLSAIVIVAPGERGGRSWSEREVFEITGDNLYNAYWGRQNGALRNSRVNSGCVPFVSVRADMPSASGREWSVAAGGRFGEKRRGGLAWFDAANPSPDHYRNLPWHRSEPHVADALREAWLAGDETVTQVDWMRMYESNIFSGRTAYVAASRIERLSDWQVAGSVRGHMRGGVYRAGARARAGRVNFFRRVDDLLGGIRFEDRDPYTGQVSNTLSPGRRVGVGDRFDYDYDIVRRTVAAYGGVDLRYGKWRVTADAEVGAVSLLRQGDFAKGGTAPGDSFGRSWVLSFTEWLLSFGGTFSFTPAHTLSLAVMACSRAPHYENIFLSPDYSARTIASPRPVGATHLEAVYRLPLRSAAGIEAAAYYTRTSGETSVMRYYDDIYDAYCDMALTGIRKRNWGVELGVWVDITDRLKLSAAFSAGSYVYAGDADMDIWTDADGTALLSGARSAIEGFVHTGSPQTLAALALTYRSRSQWSFTAECMYADRRYVTVSPLRRTARVLALAASPEERDAFFRQERLPAATVVNAAVTKGFDLGAVRLFASLTVSNLLGDRNIIYGGYEQMRLDEVEIDGRDVYRPFPSRYRFYYPRTFFATLTVSF